MGPRVATGVVLLLLAAGLLALPGWYFLGGSALLAGLAFWEWARLVYPAAPGSRRAYLAGALLLLAAAAWYCGLPEGARAARVEGLMILALGWWLAALLLLIAYPRAVRLWRAPGVRALMGVAVLLPCWVALVFLRAAPQGFFLVAALLLAIALLDSMAYFGGRWRGKRLLAPAISPAKTWEGVVCGLLALLAATPLLWRLQWLSVELLPLLGIALLVGLAGILGDLLESMVKRACGAKDSGRLLPGHGGVLDRIDSLSAAAPVYTLCLFSAGRF